MNPYFLRDTGSFPPPALLVAQLESIERREPRGLLVTWDAVPLDWAEHVWEEAGDTMTQEEMARLLDQAPIYHIEMWHHSNSVTSLLKHLRRFSTSESFNKDNALGQWFKMHFLEEPLGNSLSYSSTSSSGIPGHLTLLQNKQPHITQHLSTIKVPVTPTGHKLRAVRARLAGIECPQLMAVLDVGQGSSNVMLNQAGEPLLYFDVGCGVGGNAAGVPSPLEFCICGPGGSRPPVFLSHWHADHFDGANDDNDLYLCDWITPKAYTFPHMAVQLNALNQGSKVFELPASFLQLSFGAAPSYTLKKCTGSAISLNNSGHALLVSNDRRNWLLPADASYKFVPLAVDMVFTGVVATHHGAKFGGVAPAKADGYGRLVYSFGRNNIHKHPTMGSMNKHAVHWHHGSWTGWPWAPAVPLGSTLPGPGGDVRSTSTHNLGPGHLGAVAVGWTAPPAVPALPASCPTCGKSFNITQN